MSWSTPQSSISLKNKTTMNKTIHIRRTIDIEISVPVDETRKETEKWIDRNLRLDGLLEIADMDHIIRNIRLAGSDDQDSVVLIGWPESQELSEFEGFYENFDFISGDTIEPCTYLVNKAWYERLRNGELRKVSEYMTK